jgi:hypothetical protein
VACAFPAVTKPAVTEPAMTTASIPPEAASAPCKTIALDNWPVVSKQSSGVTRTRGTIKTVPGAVPFATIAMNHSSEMASVIAAGKNYCGTMGQRSCLFIPQRAVRNRFSLIPAAS